MTKLHLRVFDDKSELVHPDGTIESFPEGPLNPETSKRYKFIQDALKKGYLEDAIDACKQGAPVFDYSKLDSSHTQALDGLVDSVTSEVGRALVGIVILQLCIKGISIVSCSPEIHPYSVRE